uniref:Arachidonate--CoA ligase n=1 Tax=Hucho hucho TaxID=62062 RepID=A0A4W5JX65_9TELE
MQTQELQSSLQLPELDELNQFFRSLPISTLVGIGALTAVLAYWLATRPHAISPPCNLQHQSEEVAVSQRITIQYSTWICIREGPCLGSRLPDKPYKWLSYKEVTTRAEYLGSGLLSQGCTPSPDQFIGVFAQNRPEWIISELACYTYSMVVVPLYDTLGPDAIRYIINTGKTSRFQISVSQIAPYSPLWALVKCSPPTPEDLSIVCFTSGTTVLFVTVRFFPQSVVYCHGGRIGFFQGDIRLLSDDMKALRPTIFPVVPRLLNRMYDKIFSQANTPLKRWLLNFAAKRKGAEVSRGVIRMDSLWDKIFFSKIQASLGGRLRMIVTGAAPASPTVLGFLRAALGCQVYEAYGQTECTAGCTFTTPGDWTSGHVGAPLPCNLIKLVDVAEKNYFARKGEGEVCVKGPNVFKGYLKDPERTAETLDTDGWLHTGDIGKWLPNGTLKIIDRKKHIFKLAQGEYISPEKIENIYIRCEPVTQLYVHGDSLQSCLVAIVVPDPETMPAWALKKGMEGSYRDLCKNTVLKKAIMEDLQRLGKASGLHSFEQVKNIHIHNEQFSIQNGLLTPTLKAKRPELREFFKEKIEDLYENISM